MNDIPEKKCKQSTRLNKMVGIIVINGASSSGRTSLVNSFCSINNNEYEKVHIDEFINNLPPQTWEQLSITDSGWEEIGRSFNEYLAHLMTQHEKVIADAFYKSPSINKHLFSTCGRDNIFYVQLFCELEELEKREQARGNRKLGLARSQFDSIYSFTDYDLRIDSTNYSVDKCAHYLSRKLSNQSINRTQVASQREQELGGRN